MRLYSHVLTKAALVCATLFLSMAVTAAPPSGLPGASTVENAADFSARPFDREAALGQRAEIHEWLLSQAVAKGLDSPIRVFVSDAEKADIDNASGEVPPRVGLSKAVNASVTFHDLRASSLIGRAQQRSNGAITGTADGGFVFTTSVTSAGAAAMRLYFSGFDLPPQTGVYLYTEEGEVFGPYTRRGPQGTGQFWSHTIQGDFVIVQLHHVGQASDDVLHRAGFAISRVGHLRPRLMAGFCSFNEDCIENAECVNQSAVTDARDAVAAMLFASGAWLYICTGGLLNDTDTTITIPHFLTANHCISKNNEAGSLETFFQFTTPCNTEPGNCPDLDTVLQDQRTLGSTITASNRNSDFTLLQLSQAAPAGSAYLGWTTAAVANSNGTPLYRISHPQGAPQAYSAHQVDTGSPTCRSLPRGNFIYSVDTQGATEGGSSGSPVVNGSGQVVGQLYGACGYTLEVCDSGNNWTVDGAFASYFSQVEPFLDNDGGGGCVPIAEICDDGVDNDCDGLVDGDDAEDCPGGGGDGAAKGEPCLVDGDCASGKCRGKPGAMVCR